MPQRLLRSLIITVIIANGRESLAGGPSTMPATAPAATSTFDSTGVDAKQATAPGETGAPNGDDLTQLSLEQLMDVRVTTVSTVSRVDERLDEAPGSVYSFSSDTIQQRGYHSLGDLLQVVPGFTVGHRDLDEVAGVRGLNANDNEKFSLLVNGQNLNGVNEPNILSGPINLDNVQRAEVVVGPSSLFQQANTLAATVNIVTKDVEGIDVIGGTGSDLEYSTTVMMGHHFSADKMLSFSFSTEAIRGYDAYPSNFRQDLQGRDLVDQLDQPNYFGILKGQVGEVSAQFTMYRTSNPELNIDAGSKLNDAHHIDQIYSLFSKIEHPFSPTLTGVVTTAVSLKEQTRLNDNGSDPVDGVGQALHQVVYETDWGLRYTGFHNQQIQAGIQGSYDHNFDDYFIDTFDGLPQSKVTLINRDSSAAGFYADDEYRLNDHWKLVGGARIDRNTRLNGDRWFPGWRSALIYEPTPNWVSKIVYNRAVRMPSALAALNDAWGSDVPSAPPWAKLAPVASNPEILTTVEWDNVVYIHQARLGANIYYQELHDFISWYGPATNIGNFSGEGLELTAQIPVTQKVNLWANSSLNNSKLHPFQQYQQNTGPAENQHIVVTPNDRIIGAPQITANIGLDWHITRDIVFSPTARYFTEQAAFDSYGQFTTIRNRYYIDANLVWSNFLHKDVTMQAGVSNLLDNRQQVAGQWLRSTYTPRGIAFIASLEYRF